MCQRRNLGALPLLEPTERRTRLLPSQPYDGASRTCSTRSTVMPLTMSAALMQLTDRPRTTFDEAAPPEVPKPARLANASTEKKFNPKSQSAQ